MAMVLGFIIPIIICVVLVYVFSILWVCRDSQAKNQAAWPWVLVILFVSPLVGVLLNLVLNREKKVICGQCQNRIEAKSAFCCYCGAANQGNGQVKPASRKPLIAAVVCWVLIILLLIGFLIGIFVVASPEMLDDWQISTGYTTISSSHQRGNEWIFNFKSASNGNKTYKNYTIKDGNAVLKVQSSCSEGELLLDIIQGEYEERFDLSQIEGTQEISLYNFEPGKITLRLTSNGAKNVKTHFLLEE